MELHLMIYCRHRVILVPIGSSVELFVRALEVALRTGASVEMEV